MLNLTDVRRVVINGFNFGSNPAEISVVFFRVNDNSTEDCGDVMITTPNLQFTCDASTMATGEYYIEVTVNGLTSTINELVTVSYGLCYQRTGINQTTVDQALFKVGLQKNVQLLRQLVQELKEVKDLLPPYAANDCCDEDYFYPVQYSVLQEAAQASYTFKDCLDSFSAYRESFLLEL